MIPSLPRSATIHLEAAKGWCELHAFLRAKEELEKIDASLCAHPNVLEVRWQIYANLERWDDALEIASAIVIARPEWPNGYIYQASSLNESNRQPQAYETLSAAAVLFPGDEIIHYDLACVCCSLKRVEEARMWLGKAIELGRDGTRLRALGDSDLEPLWRELKI